jgi:hypothetical protein
MVGGESSFRQTMPLMIRQAPKGARMSKRKQLKKSSCRSTGDGVKVQERQGTVTDPALPSREGDARGRAPRLGGRPLAKWPLLHGGERRRETGRGGPVRNPARLRGPKSGLGMRVLKPRGECARDLGWCHLRKDDLPRAPHPLKDGDPGTGTGHLEGVRDPGAPMGGELHTDRHLRVREERKAHFRW